MWVDLGLETPDLGLETPNLGLEIGSKRRKENVGGLGSGNTKSEDGDGK